MRCTRRSLSALALLVATFQALQAQQGNVVPFGSAPSTVTGYAPGISLGGNPGIGQPVVAGLFGAPPFSQAFLALGAATAPSVVLGCPIYIDWSQPFGLLLGTSDAEGQILVPGFIPNDPMLVGVHSYLQWVVLNPESPNSLFVTSFGLDLSTGDGVPTVPPFVSYELDPTGADPSTIDITGGGVNIVKPVHGGFDLEFTPGSTPGFMNVELASFDGEFDSINTGGPDSGPVHVVRSSDTPAVGTFNVATGHIDIPMMNLSFLYAALGHDPDLAINDNDRFDTPPELHFMATLDANRDPVSGQITGNFYWWSPMNVGVPLGLNLGFAILANRDGILHVQAPARPMKVFRNVCLDVKVLRDNAGMNAAATLAQVNASIAAANAIWAQCCVSFTLNNNNVTFINSTALLNLPGPNDGNATMPGCQPVISLQWAGLIAMNVNMNCINVYLINNFVPGPVMPATMPPTACPNVLAGTTGGGTANAAIVQRTNANPNLGQNLAHELGHAMGNLPDLAPAMFPMNVMRGTAPPFGTQLSMMQCQAGRQGALMMNTMMPCNCMPQAMTP